MAHITQRPEIASAHRRRGVFMPVLLMIFALAVLGLSLLARPADQVFPLSTQEATMRGTDAAVKAATTLQREDWHGNYNMVRR
jgi:hypothetical protein